MRKLLLILALLCPSPIFAAIAATAQWDVRTVGSDTNGGAFDPSVTSPGTDFSQQTSAQVAFTDLVIGATNTQLTSAANAFSSVSPGNFVNITGGTGFTAGWYEILSVSGSTATMDRAVGTASSTGGTGNLGGALLTIQRASTNSASGNTIWVKSGTYTITSIITISVVNLKVSGYGTTHGDNGTAPIVTTSTASTGIFKLNGTNGGVQIVNDLAMSSTGTTPDSGIFQVGVDAASQTFILTNSSMSGFPSDLDFSGASGHFRVGFVVVNNSEFKDFTTTAINNFLGMISVTGSYLHTAFGGQGIVAGGGSSPSTVITVIRSIFSGCGNWAIGSGAGTVFVAESSFFNNTTAAAVGTALATFIDNIFYGNGTAINNSGGSTAFQIQSSSTASRNNAFGANTNGNLRWNASQGDITLSVNPWVNSSTGNFALNSTAGGGAALKAAGYPGVFPGGTTTSFPDVGAAQSSGGGTAIVNNFGMSN